MPPVKAGGRRSKGGTSTQRREERSEPEGKDRGVFRGYRYSRMVGKGAFPVSKDDPTQKERGPTPCFMLC